MYVKPGPWTGLDWTIHDIDTRNPVRVLDFFLFTFFSCGIGRAIDGFLGQFEEPASV